MDLASAGASCSMATAVGPGLVSHMVEYAVYKGCTAKVAKGYFFKVRAGGEARQCKSSSFCFHLKFFKIFVIIFIES